MKIQDYYLFILQQNPTLMKQRTFTEKLIRQDDMICTSENVEEKIANQINLSLGQQPNGKSPKSSNSRAFSRKKDSNLSSFQNYKNFKRKSQQKIQYADAPPLVKRISVEREKNIQKEEKKSRKKSKQFVGNTYVIKVVHRKQQEQKKVFRHPSLNEQLSHKNSLQSQQSFSPTVTSSFQTSKLTEQIQHVNQKMSQIVQKRSKTQKFVAEQLINLDNEPDFGNQSQLTESQKLYIDNLKQTCKSVTSNNKVLKKRINWLKEQVQMHMERQSLYQKQKTILETKTHNEKIIQLQNTIQKISQQLKLKNEENKNLKLKIKENQQERVELHFQINELQNQLSEKEFTFEQYQKEWKIKLNENEEVINSLSKQKQHQFTEVCDLNLFIESKQKMFEFINKKIEEIKHLKIEIHTLKKIKEQKRILTKQLLKTSQQRDRFKKKLLVKLKEESQRKMREQDSLDQNDFILSEISSPSSHHADVDFS